MPLQAIAIQLGVNIGLWAINRYLLRDEDHKLPKPKPEGLEFANNTIGTPHAYIAGTVRVDDPVMVWNGNHRATAYGSTGRFVYEADVLLVVGVPIWDSASAPWGSWRSVSVPRARRMWYGDKQFVFNTPLLHSSERLIAIQIDDVGMVGYVEFFDGRADQSLTGSKTYDALIKAGASASLIPGYRHKMLFSLLTSFGGSSTGLEPRIPAIGVEVSAVGPEPPGPTGEFGQPLGIDANPAWIIYDLLCRPVWGIGVDPDDVDLASFESAADTLVAENHGCSIVIYRAEDAAKILTDICAQTDGVLFLSPATGKIKFKLIRAVSPMGLLELTVDNVAAQPRPEIDYTSERQTVNEVRVRFTDRSRSYKPNTATAQKLANAAVRDNRRRPLDFDAPGCMTETLASRIAARELAIHGRPLMTMRATVNREFYALELGDAVKVTLPQYQLTERVFRVLEVDTGQRADGAIRLMLVEDVFGVTTGGYPIPAPEPTPTLLPITDRYFDEAPYHLAYLAALAGVVPNIGEQRLLACATKEADTSTQFRVDTTAGGPGGVYGFATLPDIPQQFFPATAVVETDYPRTAEPYDTVTGLRVADVGGTLPSPLLFWFELAATPSEIINQGKNLALLGGGPGRVGEIIAFESVTDLGGDVYRLNNVWRGLLDTMPIDHAVGTRLYLLSTDAVGRRDWITDQYARGYSIPSRTGYSGSDGVDASDDLAITVAGRRFLPLRAADVRVTGYDIDGTPGPGAEVQPYPRRGDFKAIRRLDGAIDITARQNRIDAGKVVRGDDPGYTAEPGTTWDVYIQKVGESEAAVADQIDLATPEATGVLVAGPGGGHGEIDVILYSKRTIGINVAQRSWQAPRIRCSVPRWRGLLASDSFDYGVLTPGWTEVSGTASVEEGASSLQRYTSAGYWLQSVTTIDGGAADGITVVRQTVDVTGYQPSGLTALVSWYSRDLAGTTIDYSQVTIAALDVDGAVLTSTTSSAIVPPSTHWQRAEETLVLPSGTRQIRVDVTLGATDVGGAGSPSDVVATRVRLQVGQMSDELLTNGSFDGALTGWTTVSGGFVVNTTNPYASNNGTIGAAQGGAFASSEIKQEVAIPTGYEYGSAVLTLARSSTIDLDAGEVVLEILGPLSEVLAAATTGAEYALVAGTTVLDVWERRQLALPLSDDATTIRVRLIANRTAGIGISGACFDDLSIRIHKDLDSVFDRDFDFRAPAWQPAPKNWQRFHLAWPTLPVPFMAWDGDSVTPTVQPTYRLIGPTHAWSDASTPDAAAFVGYWDIGPDADEADAALAFVTSTEAYQFTRAIAANAIDLQTIGQADESGDEYGAFSVDESFSVAVLFRTDELTWSTAAGLVGRRGDTGLGWGMRLTAAGLLEAVMQGASATATATAASSVADRAPHWAFLVHDAGAATLTLYDDHGGSATTSTAAIGSIDVAGAPLRIGRDGPASATGGIQIARVYLWRAVLRASDVEAIIRYGADPSELLTTWSSDQALWVPGPNDAAGATVPRFAADQVPIGYAGAAYGLVTATGNTNAIPSHDFTDSAHWTTDAGITLTHGIADPTGLPYGVRVANTSAPEILRCEDIPLSGSSTISVVFWARTTDSVVNYTLALVLRDAAANIIDVDTATITSLWKRFTITFTGWTDPTPTALLDFSLGAIGSFELAHVIWCGLGDPPFAVQDAGAAHGGTSAIRDELNFPLQASYEGELYVEGICAASSPPENQSLVEVDAGGVDEGSRVLYTGSFDKPTFTLYDDAALTTTEAGTAIDWSQTFTLRGRWNSLEFPESPGDQVGLVVDGSVDSETYEASAFAVGATPLTTIRIGGDPTIGDATDAVIHRVRVRSREPKL